MGQAQILAAALFLLLIPTTIIVAQNATDNVTGDTVANITAGIPSENATEDATLPAEENNTSDFSNESETEEGTTLINETNLIIPLNDTNITPPEENITLSLNETNVTPPDNQTQEPPEQEEEPESLGPILEVSLDLPERANRNEPFLLSAEIANTGDTDALDVEIKWILPDGLSILAGSGSHYCDVPAGATCTSDLKVVTPLSSELGEREIKILVRYFE